MDRRVNRAVQDPARPGQAASLRELLHLAVPAAVFAVLTNAFRSVDQYWIRGVSTEAQAALGTSTFVVILFYASFQLAAAGASPIVARLTGAGDQEGRRAVLGAAMGLALAAAAVIALVGGLGAEAISALLGLSGATAEAHATYLRTLALTLAPLALTPVVDQAFIAMGSARLPMVLHAVSLALNLVLTPVLIYRLDLGVAGAALASNLSRAATTLPGLWALARRTGLRPADLVDAPPWGRVARIGLPAALGVAAYTLVYWGMLATSISPLGPTVNAALGIGFSALEGFTWPAFHGLGLAVASLVGRSLGAGRPDRAWRVALLGLGPALALGTAALLAFLLLGDPLTGFFAADEAVHRAAATYAAILALSQPAVALETLAEGVLNGAGDTRTVFWLSVPFNALRIPLAWALAIAAGWGAPGAWWAINLTTYAKCAAKVAAVLRGRWTEVAV